jgi:hypothetical protein
VLVLALATAAGLAGLRHAGLSDVDTRRSTFLAGPAGARGYADALSRLGERVERWRRPLAMLPRPAGAGAVLALAITGLVQIFIYPLFYCVLTITYYDLRVRKEGFDLELLASQLRTA